MPRGSHFLLLRQTKVTKEKATPTIVLILRCSEKSGTKKTRFAQTVFPSDRFFLLLLGANQRGPVEPIFDRFAMGFARRGCRGPGRIEIIVTSTLSRYNKEMYGEPAPYEANLQPMIFTFKRCKLVGTLRRPPPPPICFEAPYVRAD